MFSRISFLCLAAMLAACGSEPGPSQGDSESQLTPILLQTDWYAQPEHAGFYQAQLDGLYEAAGLAVEIRPGANMTNVPQMVATGRIEFAVGTTDNLFMAASRGAPLVALVPYFQHDPQCVMFHATNDIETLADLDGRVVMINPGAAYVQYLQKALEIKPQLVPLDYGLARFLADPEFIQQCFVTSEPYYVAQQGVEAEVLRLSSSGFDPYRVVYTNQRLLDESPELVRAFVKASLEGWARYQASDGTRVHAHLQTLNPQQTPEFAAWTKAAIDEYQLIDGYPEAGDGLGRFDRARLETHLEHLEAIDLLDRPLDLDTVVAFELQALVDESTGS